MSFDRAETIGLARWWWTFVLRGALAILFGVLAWFAPKQPLSFLMTAVTSEPYPYTYAFLIGLLQAQWTFTGYDAKFELKAADKKTVPLPTFARLLYEALNPPPDYMELPFTAVLVALMSIFLVNRHTRAEEDVERAELVRSSVIGRHAPTAAPDDFAGCATTPSRCWAPSGSCPPASPPSREHPAVPELTIAS